MRIALTTTPAVAPALPPAGRELVRFLYYYPGDWDPAELRVRTSGVVLGSASGYGSFESAARAASELTSGWSTPAAAILAARDGAGALSYFAVGTRMFGQEFRFERGEDLPTTADDMEVRDPSFVGIVDGDRVHRFA